jgi:hypothetical protein
LFCSKCGVEFQDEWKFCAKCGSKAPEADQPKSQETELTQNPEVLDRSGKLAKSAKFQLRTMMFLPILAVFIVVILIFSIGGIVLGSGNSSENYKNSSSSTWTPRATPLNNGGPSTTSWIPQGFKELNSLVAYKPAENMDCGYSTAHSCYQIYVVTAEPCQVFIEVNFEVDGVVVDSSIDSATIGRNQQAILEFASFETAKYSGNKKVRFTSITCY